MMNIRSFCLNFMLMAALLAPSKMLANCVESEQSCKVPLGSYEIALPKEPHNAPVVVFLHGFGGSGMGAMRQSHIAKVFLDRGYAVLAPNGLPRPGGGQNSWSFHPERENQRDDLAFFDQALQNAVVRFGLDRSRVMLTGFSIGASMTHYVACSNPDMFAAYAPVAGSFWRPHPDVCVGQVKLLHTHGWTDSTFPLEGRMLGNGFAQGDAFVTTRIWRETNKCTQTRAKEFSRTGEFMRRAWTECADGTALEFALFDGGHVVPKGWANMAVDWFEAVMRK